ncbi:MAG TPA: ParB/RepB/Spo0J family partition protein [Candidatus Cloacimonetes bacterium]|nr:ParB/RepB/Spo0J family partition protein [Candidatus Cloacimonadota bacterium]
MSSKLGKGLEALLQIDEDEKTGVQLVEIGNISFNPYQPRKSVNKQRLQELAQSISENGIIQPIILRKIGENKYELIAGQRRITAAKIAGLTKVPAIIRSAKNLEMLSLALVENLQREDLNAIDEAMAYQRFVEEFSFTHEKIAEVVGKSRAAVTNSLRLLRLPEQVIELIKNEELSAGHARAILQVDPSLQTEFAKYIVKNEISVRKAEEISKKFGRAKKDRKPAKRDIHLVALENDLERKFGTRVKIKGYKKGKFEIYYHTEEEFEKILDIILHSK